MKDSRALDWWTTFHRIEMADLFLTRSDADELRRTIDFLCRELNLKKNSHVYDQCCGTGGLSLPMADRGIRVTGCDLCDEYIQRARTSVACNVGSDSQATADFYCEDAFDFVPEQPCDGVFNWYSSFGYSPIDSLNIKMLQRAFEALLPGGLFAMDVPNFVRILSQFQPEMRRSGESGGRQVMLIRKSRIDHINGLLHQVWRWEIEGQPTDERESSLRMYLPYQIGDMLTNCGFEKIRLLGDLGSEDFHSDSLRLILVAQRPHR